MAKKQLNPNQIKISCLKKTIPKRKTQLVQPSSKMKIIQTKIKTSKELEIIHLAEHELYLYNQILTF